MRKGNRQMRKIAAVCLGSVWLVGNAGAGLALDRPTWADAVFGERRWEYVPRRQQSEPPSRPPVQREALPLRDDVREGGLRPEITPAAPAIVAFAHDYQANSIVIDTTGRKLYFVLGDKRAYEYPISVGREGFNWTGTETISRKQAWPDWHPPQEMRERDVSLPAKMTGGIKNPLGAMALYLGNTLYRIHGTNDVKSIGHAQSSGCFRMLNSAVLHLASVTEIGTPVAVVSSLNSGKEIARNPAQPILPRQRETRPAEQTALPERSGPATRADRARDYWSLRAYALERQ